MIKKLIPFILFNMLLFSCTPPDPSESISQTVTALDALTSDIETFRLQAENLSTDVDDLILQIETPDVDWQWISVQGGDWKPTQLDLIVMQRNIQAHVKAAARSQMVEVRDWDGFTFQYQGSNDPHPQIHIFALCKVHGTVAELEVEFINDISDGGTCYFAVSYDPENKEFSQVAFHGEA